MNPLCSDSCGASYRAVSERTHPQCFEMHFVRRGSYDGACHITRSLSEFMNVLRLEAGLMKEATALAGGEGTAADREEVSDWNRRVQRLTRGDEEVDGHRGKEKDRAPVHTVELSPQHWVKCTVGRKYTRRIVSCMWQ